VKSAVADGQRTRRHRSIAFAIALMLVVAAIVVWVAVTRPVDAGSDRARPDRITVPRLSTRPGWRVVGGFRVPVSAVDGPRRCSPSTADGFSHSLNGAALAAVNIVVRSSASAGASIYGPTITRQLVGSNVAVLKLQTDQAYEQLRESGEVEMGAPVPATAVAAGYQIAAYAPDLSTAQVAIFLRSAGPTAEHTVRFEIQLVWRDDDWRVVAPPNGDWQTVATPIAELPPDIQRYEDLVR
jgi:hypothetical protein